MHDIINKDKLNYIFMKKRIFFIPIIIALVFIIFGSIAGFPYVIFNYPFAIFFGAFNDSLVDDLDFLDSYHPFLKTILVVLFFMFFLVVQLGAVISLVLFLIRGEEKYSKALSTFLIIWSTLAGISALSWGPFHM